MVGGKCVCALACLLACRFTGTAGFGARGQFANTHTKKERMSKKEEKKKKEKRGPGRV